MMKIFAIVVTYNGMRWYDKCLGSLLSSEVPLEIVVIDNASTDNSVKYISDNYPKVYIIESSRNWGFAKANNIAIKYAIQRKADYIFLLNQDAWIETSTIAHLLSTFKIKENVGVVSPVHLNGNKAGLDMYFASFMPWTFVSDAYFSALKELYEVQFINAAAWLISIDCINKIGGFDTSLFVHSGEDSNYCQRVIYHGFKILINTHSRVYHDKTITVQDFLSKDDYVKKEMNKNFDRKITEANILVDRNISEIIKNKKSRVILNTLLLKFNKVKILKNEISFLESIEISRRLNKAGGLIWLE